MNTKTILGISFAAVFAVSMMLSPAFAGAPPGYLLFDSTSDVSKSNSNANNANDRIKVTIDTQGTIPLDGSGGAFGYGIFTGGEATDNVLVLVTHLGIDDSDHEDPTSGFHTHVLDLKGPTVDCTGFDAEVDLDESGMNKGFDLDADWEIDEDVATVGYTPTKRLNGSTTVDGVAAFTVSPVFDGPTLTNLCLDVVGTGSGL